MGEIRKPLPVQHFCGVIFSSDAAMRRAVEMLEAKFGEIDFRSEVLIFDKTDYYAPEMGAELKRMFVAYKQLGDPGALPAAKISTNDIEEELAREYPLPSGGRPVNLDPGTLDSARVILATTKDYQHRIYLADGILAEITLRYKDGTYIPNEWTYPDYRTPEYIAIFNQLRTRFREKLKAARAASPDKE